MRNLPKLIFSINFLYILLIAAECAAIIFLCVFVPSFLPVAVAFASCVVIADAARSAVTVSGFLFAVKGLGVFDCKGAAFPLAGRGNLRRGGARF